MRLERSKCILVVIDVQERMMKPIHASDEVARNAERLVRGCTILGVPVVATEQYVKGLGPTIEPLRAALDEAGAPRLEKLCFSAGGSDAFNDFLRKSGRTQVIVAGVEAHVCVYQTCADLLAKGLEVTIAADAVSSRKAENRDVAIRRMLSDGARLSSTEMALFELLGAAGTDEFRAISSLIK